MKINNNASRLVLGTAQFGMRYGISNPLGKVSCQEVEKILEYAKSVGVRTLDTAVAYGEAESTLGRVGVNDFQIVSKLPAMPPETKNVEAWVFSFVEQSLKKLNVNRLSGLLLHAPAQLLSPKGEALVESVYKVKNQGLTSKVGVSVYSFDELLSYQKLFSSDIVQLPRNIIDGRNRNIVTEIELHARSVFLQGLLLMPVNNLPNNFVHYRETFQRFQNWCAANGLSLIEACLGAVVSMPDVDKIVVGVQSASELKQVVQAIGRSCVDVPVELQVVDEKLLNPSKWPEL